MSRVITIKELEKAEAKDYPVILREMAEDAKAEQTAVLMDIIESAKNTEYGKKHNFDKIKTVDDFKKNVKVNEYSDFAEYIDEISNGKSDVLFPGNFFEFGGTTGTTGKSKLVPESEIGDLVKRIVVNLRVAESSRMFPAQSVMGNKKFTITNSSLISSGNQTITSASGQAVARADASARARLAVPVELLQIKDIELDDLDYLTMLFGLGDKNVVALVCNNVVHFYNLLKKLNENAEKFFNDIENGTLTSNIPDSAKQKLLSYWKADGERANKLRKIYNEKGRLDVSDFWPDFGLVNCWLSSSVGRYAKEYAYIFPETTKFIHWGYGATEGKFDIPTEPFSPKGIPALFGYFFEFLELGKDEPVTITETNPDTYYELVITSYSGFYRYNIHDIVTVCKGDDGLYRLEFICKSYDSINLGGKTLYASEITEYIEDYEEKNNVFLRYFHGEDSNGKLLLRIETESKLDQKDFENFISKKLKDKGISLDSVIMMPQGTREKALVVDFDGKPVNQTKLLVFK